MQQFGADVSEEGRSEHRWTIFVCTDRAIPRAYYMDRNVVTMFPEIKQPSPGIDVELDINTIKYYANGSALPLIQYARYSGNGITMESAAGNQYLRLKGKAASQAKCEQGTMLEYVDREFDNMVALVCVSDYNTVLSTHIVKSHSYAAWPNVTEL